VPFPPAEKFVYPVLTLATLGALAGGLVALLVFVASSLNRKRAVILTTVAVAMGGSGWLYYQLRWHPLSSWQAHRTETLARFSPDSGMLVTTGSDFDQSAGSGNPGTVGYTIKLWELPSCRLMRSIEVPGGLRYLAISPDGQWIASLGDSICIHSVATGELIIMPGFAADKFAFTSNSRQLIALTFDAQSGYEIHVWDTSTWTLDINASFKVQPPNVQIWTMLSPDGTVLAARTETGVMRAWSVPDKRELTVPASLRWDFTDLNGWPTFSADGQWLIGGSDLWNIRTGELVHLGTTATVTGGRDGPCVSHSTTTIGELVHYQVSFAFRYHPFWTRLEPVSYSRLTAWSPESPGEVTTSLPTHAADKITMSPDGRFVASTNYGGTVNLWDVPAPTGTGAKH
jgi:WD40 repeat protein